MLTKIHIKKKLNSYDDMRTSYDGIEDYKMHKHRIPDLSDNRGLTIPD